MPTYHITTPDGKVYEVDATDDANAQRIGAWINERVAAGDPDLVSGGAPFELNIERGKAEQPEVTMGGALTRGLIGGGTLNWGDEVAALANAAGLAPLDNLTGFSGEQQAFWDNPEGFWAAFQNNKDQLNALDAADAEQQSGARAVGQIAGALGTSITGGRLALNAAGRLAPAAAIPAAAMYEAQTLSNPIRTAAATGAVTGGTSSAISAAGAGEGNRGQSAALGAGAGVVFGAGAGATIAGIAPAVRRYWDVLRGKAPEQEALAQLVQALRRDGYDVTSPRGVQALRQELQSYNGKPVSLADVGTAIRGRVGVGLRAPSAAQNQSVDQVISRSQAQGERLSSDIRATVAPRTDVYALDQALVDQRGAEALPLRERAIFERKVIPPEMEPLPLPPVESPTAGLERMLGETAPPIGPLKPMDDSFMTQLAAKADPVEPPVPTAPQVAGPPAPTIIDRTPRMVEDDVLNNLANNHPLAQRALSKAISLSQSERALKQMMGQDLEDVPEILAGQPLDYRTVDYLKRFLDREVDNLFRRGQSDTFSMAEAQQVKALRDAIRTRMRDTNDEYGQYLDAYSGSSDMIDALAEGRTFHKLDPEHIAAGQAGRTPAEQELYRVGAARRLEDIINDTRDGRNAAQRILNDPKERARLEALNLQPGAADQLNTAVQQERTLNLLPAELSGSPTTQRLQAAQDADAGISATLPFNPSSGWGWLGAIGRAAANRASVNRNAAVNEALLPRAIATDPAQIDATINDLIARGDILNADRLRRQALAARRAA